MNTKQLYDGVGVPFYPVINNELTINNAKLYITNQDLVFDFANLKIYVPCLNEEINLTKNNNWYYISNDLNDELYNKIRNKIEYGYIRTFINYNENDIPDIYNIKSYRYDAGIADGFYGFGPNTEEGIFYLVREGYTTDEHHCFGKF